MMNDRIPLPLLSPKRTYLHIICTKLKPEIYWSLQNLVIASQTLEYTTENFSPHSISRFHTFLRGSFPQSQWPSLPESQGPHLLTFEASDKSSIFCEAFVRLSYWWCWTRAWHQQWPLPPSVASSQSSFHDLLIWKGHFITYISSTKLNYLPR